MYRKNVIMIYVNVFFVFSCYLGKTSLYPRFSYKEEESHGNRKRTKETGKQNSLYVKGGIDI